ncbi:MAG: flavin reductase family protein [Cellulosilyticum sp.]|nr:flavin reductase family protein [Cellulosilyticum sp.]
MHKTKWKAGNMIYPLPAVMVSCGDEEVANIVTVAWTGTICTNPPMTYISLRPARHSYDIIKRTGVFVINLTTEDIVRATDFCGVKSGRDLDKFAEMGLTMERDEDYKCPMIVESPVSIVCETVEIKELGSHHMFIANVKAVYVDESYMNEKGKFELNETGLIAYSHGSYLKTGEELGTFGYSISKKKKAEEQRVATPLRTKKTAKIEATHDQVPHDQVPQKKKKPSKIGAKNQGKKASPKNTKTQTKKSNKPSTHKKTYKKK